MVGSGKPFGGFAGVSFLVGFGTMFVIWLIGFVGICGSDLILVIYETERSYR